jgi:hypothetical protein
MFLCLAEAPFLRYLIAHPLASPKVGWFDSWMAVAGQKLGEGN